MLSESRERFWFFLLSEASRVALEAILGERRVKAISSLPEPRRAIPENVQSSHNASDRKKINFFFYFLSFFCSKQKIIISDGIGR